MHHDLTENEGQDHRSISEDKLATVIEVPVTSEESDMSGIVINYRKKTDIVPKKNRKANLR